MGGNIRGWYLEKWYLENKANRCAMWTYEKKMMVAKVAWLINRLKSGYTKKKWWWRRLLSGQDLFIWVYLPKPWWRRLIDRLTDSKVDIRKKMMVAKVAWQINQLKNGHTKKKWWWRRLLSGQNKLLGLYLWKPWWRRLLGKLTDSKVDIRKKNDGGEGCMTN